MSKTKKEIKDLADLPHYNEEFTASSRRWASRSLPDLLDALNETKKKSRKIVDELDGVGPKYAEHWTSFRGIAIDRRVRKWKSAVEGGEGHRAGHQGDQDRGGTIEIVETPKPRSCEKGGLRRQDQAGAGRRGPRTYWLERAP